MNERFHRLLFLGISRLRGRPLGACLRQLHQWERLDARAFHDLRVGQLARTLEHAKRSVPFYRSAEWQHADPRSLRSWPVLDRGGIQAHGRDLLALPVPRHYYRSTSGSTGQPLTVGVDGKAAAWAWATEYRGLSWHGIGLGARNVKLGHIPESRFADWVRNRDFRWTGDMSSAKLDEVVDLIRRVRPAYVWGYVSALVELARHARGSGKLVPYAKVFGEKLFPSQRDEIEEGLGARVIETYGCNETGTAAYECPSGSLHVFAEHVEVEVVNNGEPVEPGETGDILLTCLTNRVMPLIRYRVGDRGRVSPVPCACGRPHPVIAGIDGRIGDVLYAADGRRVHGALLGDVLKVAVLKGAVRQAFFDQRDRRAWTIQVQPGVGFDEGTPRFLADNVRRIFGQECRVTVEVVPEIRREKSGKLRFYRAAPAGSGDFITQ
ncbi:MAG: phenylacetate--CoA ligase family protein [Gemmatimonadales bacterium]